MVAGREKPAGGFVEELRGDVEVHLGRNEGDVAEVVSEEGQAGLYVAAVAVP